MDQRALFDLAVQLKNTLPPIHQNNRAMAAADSLLAYLATDEIPFVYSADFTAANNNAVAPGGQPVFQINIQQDAAFRIMAGCFFADIAVADTTDATRVLPNVNVMLTDQGSWRFFFDRPAPINSLFGVGMNPFPWPVPMTMNALSTLQVQLFSFSAATTYNIRLAFIGVKLYKYSRQ